MLWQRERNRKTLISSFWGVEIHRRLENDKHQDFFYGQTNKNESFYYKHHCCWGFALSLSLCIIIGELEEGWEKIELAFMAQFNPYSNELSLEFHEFITP